VTPAGSVRLFVVLELPAAVRGALSGWAREHAGGQAGLRLVDPESLHVTLCFLGSRPATEIEEIAAACQAAVSGLPAAQLTLGHALWLPPRRPRVLTVELTDDDDRLSAVQSALAGALAQRGFYKPESRPFLAHVTTARVHREARLRPTDLPAPNQTRFTSNRVTLFESRLGRGPAHYEPLSSTELQPA
jgi:RNA 2',3'-cyclic 3'-phosphodiesterase